MHIISIAALRSLSSIHKGSLMWKLISPPSDMGSNALATELVSLIQG